MTMRNRIRDIDTARPAPAIIKRIIARDNYRCVRCCARNHAVGGHTKSGAFLPAHALGEHNLRGGWPRSGDYGWCGPQNKAQRLRVMRISLTVAPLNHRATDCSDNNLITLCQRCLAIHEIPLKRAHIVTAQRAGWVAADLFQDERA